MEYNTKSNDDRSVCAKNEVKNIQCVEVEKRLKKSVDKRRKRWYDNKAVARESRKKAENLHEQRVSEEKDLTENLLAEKKFTDVLKAKKSVLGSSEKTSEKNFEKSLKNLLTNA